MGLCTFRSFIRLCGYLLNHADALAEVVENPEVLPIVRDAVDAEFLRPMAVHAVKEWRIDQLHQSARGIALE